MATITMKPISKWSNLPSDVLASIADRLDPEIGIIRLHSVCRSWRSSFPTIHSTINFPLKLPIPLTSSHPSPSFLFLHQRTIYFLPLKIPINEGFIIKLEQIQNTHKTFSLCNPLSAHPKPSQPNSPLNILDHRLTHVCNSYFIHSNDESINIPIRKVVVAKNFFEKGDFVVLGLKFSGNLLIWRFGDECWTEIAASGRCFDDIISFKGKFYATADRKGRLVMIDSNLKPIDLVSRLMYGNGSSTSLVECDGNLYLVDRDLENGGSGFGVFKLDDKGRFWDYELNLNDCVFFLGDDANFSLSMNHYNGCVRNVIYFKDDEFDGLTRVFEMNTSNTSVLEDAEEFCRLYWPPRSWFDDLFRSR